MGSDTISPKETISKNVVENTSSCSDDSSEVVSDLESESDFVPPSPFSPLPLTASEELTVEQCTRIGLVATHKCPSDILTEDDRREMAAIRRSMGMLPRKSEAADNRAQCVQQMEKCPELSPLGQDRESVQSSHIIPRSARKVLRSPEEASDRWAADTSDTVSSDVSGRGRYNSDEDISITSSHQVIAKQSYKESPDMVHSSPGNGGEWMTDGDQSRRHISVDCDKSNSENCKQLQRTCCSCSNCVSMAKPRPDGVRVYRDTAQRSHTANSSQVVCVMCRNSLQCQHCGGGCPIRNDCFGQHSSLYYDSHSLMPQRASLRHSSPELWRPHYTTLHPPLATSHPPASPQGQGSYFLQYMMKRKRYRKGRGCLPPISIPPPLPPPSLHCWQTYNPKFHVQQLRLLQNRKPTHRAGVTGYADMYYSRVHK